MNNTLPQTVNLIQQGIEAGQHIGAQLTVKHRGQLIADLALGQSRPDVPMTTDTLVPWLSAGKPLTAVGIAQLWEQGQLQLDDRIARFIPEFAVHGKQPITLRHLLTHTGGFRSVAMVATISSWQDYVRLVSASRLESDWTPGHTAGYHINSSWIILGEIIRRITGQNADAYLRQYLFEPLGMMDTWLTIQPQKYEQYADRIALLPHTDPAQPSQTHTGFTNTPQGAATLLPGQTARGPIRELTRFYEMLANHGESILQPQTVEAITARHRTGLFDRTFHHIMDWGLGFIINSRIYPPSPMPYGYGAHAGRRTFGHGGRQTSVGMVDPDNDLIVALAFNGMPGEAAHVQRIDRVLTQLYEELGLASPQEA